MISRSAIVFISLVLHLFLLGGCVDRIKTAAPATTATPSGAELGEVQPDPGAAKVTQPTVVTTLEDERPPVTRAAIDSLRVQLASMEVLIAGLKRDLATIPDSGRTALALPAVAARDDTTSVIEPKAAIQGVRNLGLRFFWAFVFTVITVMFLRTVQWILERSAERIVTRRLFFKKLIPIIRIITWMALLFIVVRYVFNIGGSELVAAGAAVGVAIGFAAQDVLKNIFGGILIILDQPFQVGDKINVGGTYGEVVSIGLRSTRIVTPDDNLVTVPNTQVVDGQVANANAGALDCQVVTSLYLPGWVDVAKAKEIAFNAAANSKYVYLEKPIVVLVKDEFKETFLSHILVKAYVLDTRFETVFASDVTETAKSEYLRLGMLYPFAPPLSPLIEENGAIEPPVSQ